MDLSGALPDEVILEVFDEKWVQTVDYEHIPFRCHRCHEHGHLLRDCPLGKTKTKSKPNAMKDPESFHKEVHKGKGNRRGQKLQQKEGQQVRRNQFQALEEKEERTTENQVNQGSTEEKEKKENRDQTQVNDKQIGTMMISFQITFPGYFSEVLN